MREKKGRVREKEKREGKKWTEEDKGRVMERKEKTEKKRKK